MPRHRRRPCSTRRGVSRSLLLLLLPLLLPLLSRLRSRARAKAHSELRVPSRYRAPPMPNLAQARPLRAPRHLRQLRLDLPNSIRKPRIFTWKSFRPRYSSLPSVRQRARSPVLYNRPPATNGSSMNRSRVSSGRFKYPRATPARPHTALPSRPSAPARDERPARIAANPESARRSDSHPNAWRLPLAAHNTSRAPSSR
ncbi:hypothetical protein Y602_6258 [Burkholderia pseudomallei MSHR733]|nr:hypothetical protein Y602_6258 [Burkholderia pseudomallei MSHR733]